MEEGNERDRSDIADGIQTPSLSPISPGKIVFQISWADHEDGSIVPGSVTIDTSEDTIESLQEEPDSVGSSRLSQQRLSGVNIEDLPNGERLGANRRDLGHQSQQDNQGMHRHPKGTYFRDGQRRIDYVLVYEERSQRHSLTHTVQDLRRLARTSSHTVMSNLKKLSISGHLVLDQDVMPPVLEAEDEQRREFFLSQLLKAGLEMEMHEYHEKGDKDRKLVFVKIHAPWKVLLREAERLRMKLPLTLQDRLAALRLSETGKQRCFDFVFLESNKEEEPFDDPAVDFDDHIAWPFSNDQIDRFDLSQNQDSLFKACRRSEVVWEVLQLTRNDPNREKRRGIESLLEHRIFEAAFPLHDGDYEFRNRVGSEKEFTTRQRLHAQWATIRKAFRPQPLNRIRNYFSEKVAFYFAFMDFYVKMLIVPSIFGLLAFFYGLIMSWTDGTDDLLEVCERDDTPGKYIMCPICQPPACEPYLMSEEGCGRAYWQYRLDNVIAFATASLNILWCAFFIKFWRRREARLAVEWDTYDVQEGVRVVRPDYEKRATDHKMNAITDEAELHVPKCKQFVWRMASVLITFAILCTAISCLAILIVCRVAMYGMFKKLGGVFRKHNIDVARWIQHGFMFIMVTVFETVYHRVAEHLTKLECPQTTSGYLSSLLWKVFIFAHLVDFLPIAYAAWFKGRFWKTPSHLNAITEMCEAGGCMNEVVELVAVLLLLRLIVQNIAEVGWPALKATWARFRTKRRGLKRNMQDSVKHVTRWAQFLKDYHLGELKLDGVSPEYMEMMIQFSFVAFFVPALPLVPLICLINNIAEIRIDAFNFLASHRRPSPARVPGIQIWNKFLDIIVKLAVVVNAALLSFTSEIVPRLYHDFDWRHPSNRTFAEYISSSLSWQPVNEWKQLKDYIQERQARPLEPGAEGGEYDIFKNLTECAYFGYRTPEKPHVLGKLFFQIMTARLIAFAVFVILFYFLIYLINSIINDVPKDVRDTIKRRQYLVTKALEEEAFRKRACAREIGQISAQISNDTVHRDSTETVGAMQQLSVESI